MRLAVEAKASARINSGHLKGLRTLAEEQPGLGRRVVVCLEPRPRRTDDGIDIIGAADFARRLWQDELLPADTAHGLAPYGPRCPTNSLSR